jgi:hypothetical protein
LKHVAKRTAEISEIETSTIGAVRLVFVGVAERYRDRLFLRSTSAMNQLADVATDNRLARTCFQGHGRALS